MVADSVNERKESGAPVEWQLPRAASVTIIAILALMGIYLLYLSSQLAVHYYDSYEYLNSAKNLSGLGSYYDFTRPPVVPFLLTPILILSRYFTSIEWLIYAPHFYMVMVSGLSLWICSKCFRGWLGSGLGLIMTLLLALDRPFFFFAPFVMPDIISAAIVTVMVYALVRLSEYGHWRDAAWAGLMLGLAVATKHYLAPLCFVPALFILGCHPYFHERRLLPRAREIYWLATVAAFSALVVFPLHRIAFWLTPEFRHQPLLDIFQQIFSKGSSLNGLNIAFSGHRIWQTLLLLAGSLGWPLLVTSLAGILISLRRPDRLRMLMLIWLVVFLFIFCVLFEHREARYFLQVTPAILFFTMVSASTVIEHWRELKGWQKTAAAISGLLVIGALAAGTIHEVTVFSDPIYRNNVAARLSQEAEKQTAAENRIIWLGDIIRMVPQQGGFINNPDYDDPVYYGLALHSNAINYYTHRMSYTLFYPYMVIPYFKGILNKGDTLISISSQASDHPPFSPVKISHFDRYWIYARTPSSSDLLVLKEQTSDSKIFLRSDRNNFLLEASGMPRSYGWVMLFKNNASFDMRVQPLFPLPVRIEMPEQIGLDAVQGIVTLPITGPETLFNY